MRALLLSPSAVAGGAERAFASLARRLPEFGVEPRAVLLASGPLQSWLADAGCPTEVIEAGRTRELHRTAATLARLTGIARSADIVVSNQSKGHVYGGLAALAARRPAVWWQHGIAERSRIECVAAAVPAALVVAGSHQAVEAQRRLTPRRRVELVHPGIDVAAVRRRAGSGASLRASRKWGSAPLVGIVGRLQEWKGQDVFLHAAARVAAVRPDVTFLVVGGAVLGWEGDYPQRLARLAVELGIEDRVHFVGHQDDVYPWFDALDVVVHASHGEPFGLVLVEAMALGKVVVATAAGGPVDIIDDERSGVLIPPGDHRQMADAIVRILGDDAYRQRLQTAASTRAKLFSDVVMSKRLASLLFSEASTNMHKVPLVADASVHTPDGDSTGHSALEEFRRRAVNAAGGTSSPEIKSLVLNLLQRVRIKNSIADIGAGRGELLRRIAQQYDNIELLGIDYLGRPDDLPQSIGWVSTDLNEPLARLSKLYDIVISSETIEHLENPRKHVRDMARLLRRDGTAILTTPNQESIRSYLSLLWRGHYAAFQDSSYPAHITPLLRRDLRRILSEAGFAEPILCYTDQGAIPRFTRLHWQDLNHRLRGRLFSDNIAVVARLVNRSVPSGKGQFE